MEPPAVRRRARGAPVEGPVAAPSGAVAGPSAGGLPEANSGARAAPEVVAAGPAAAGGLEAANVAAEATVGAGDEAEPPRKRKRGKGPAGTAAPLIAQAGARPKRAAEAPAVAAAVEDEVDLDAQPRRDAVPARPPKRAKKADEERRRQHQVARRPARCSRPASATAADTGSGVGRLLESPVRLSQVPCRRQRQW